MLAERGGNISRKLGVKRKEKCCTRDHKREKSRLYISADNRTKLCLSMFGNYPHLHGPDNLSEAVPGEQLLRDEKAVCCYMLTGY